MNHKQEHALRLDNQRSDSISRWFRAPSDYIFMAIVYVLLFLFAAVIIIPMIFMLASSLSSAEAIAAGRVLLWPVDFSIQGYKTILSTSSLYIGFLNSVFYMTAGTGISIILTMLIAYPLTRSDFKARNLLMTLLLITMFFNGGLIPTYLLIRNLGMLDTRWAMILPSALSAYNVILVRTYIKSTIPLELYESASLDGCGSFRYFLSIVVPLSKTIIAVITLIYGVGIWNRYFDSMMYLTDARLFPLQLVLRNILMLNQSLSPADINNQREIQMFTYLLKYSTIIVGSVPMMIVYPFVQKHFVKGVMIGAIKG